MADVFTVALIKGAVEGDLFAHFGSLRGMDEHVGVAETNDLLDPFGGYGGRAVATDKARRIYRECRLADLPDGRAYLAWVDRPEVAAALAALGGEVS